MVIDAHALYDVIITPKRRNSEMLKAYCKPIAPNKIKVMVCLMARKGSKKIKARAKIST